MEIEIDGRKIGPKHPPYIIAELSGNHNGDINRAIRLIEIAHECGADAVKLQTYTADSLTLNSDDEDFILKSGTWSGRKLYELYEEAHTPWDWHPQLFDVAKALGITIFSSPFDKKAVDFLTTLNVPAFKIASNELTDWPLVQHIARTGKPMILSTGTSSKQDIAETIDFLRANNAHDFTVLHCVSAYPAPPEDANLKTICEIADSFNVIPGFSDHTMGTTAAIAAVALGACVIEKHITLDRNDGGPDSSFSLEPAELEALCKEIKWAYQSLGKVQYGGDTDLQNKSIFTRRFWSIKDIRVGDVLTEENIKSIRAPKNKGIRTKHFQEVFGKKALQDIPRHAPVEWESIGLVKDAAE